MGIFLSVFLGLVSFLIGDLLSMGSSLGIKNFASVLSGSEVL
jgi:hypothetical protein